MEFTFLKKVNNSIATKLRVTLLNNREYFWNIFSAIHNSMNKLCSAQSGHRPGRWQFWGRRTRERRKQWGQRQIVAWGRGDGLCGRRRRYRIGGIRGGGEQGAGPPAEVSRVFHQLWQFQPTWQQREVPVWGRYIGATAAANGWRGSNTTPVRTDTR